MARHPRVLIVSTFLFATPAFAASKYKPMKDCGTAKVISGDTCSNVKVEMNFEGCALKSEPQLAKRIVCEGTTIKARFQDDNYRYEAAFDKTEGGWGGGVTWKSLGAVKQWEKEKGKEKEKVKEARHTASVEVHPTPNLVKAEDRQPAAAAPPVIPPAVPASSSVPNAPASPLKFSGFFDVRYSTFSASADPNVADAHSETGFGLEDGSFYANYEKDKVSFILDVAFRRSKAGDPGTPSSNASDNNNFGIAVDKSQLYMRYKASDQVVVDFGQFDTIFGVELNDSKDRAFGKTGLIYDAFLPLTHTGLMAEYANNGFYGKAFAANPMNKGSYGTTTDHNTEYGAAAGWANEKFHGQLGYMSRPIKSADGVGMGDRTFGDVTAGAILGKFTIDLEYAMTTDPSKNSLTPTDTSDREKAATGMLALVTYKICDPLTVGARYEHMDNDPLSVDTTKATAIDTADSFGATVHYRISPDLELRSEYVGYNYKAANNGKSSGEKWYDARFNAAAVLTF